DLDPGSGDAVGPGLALEQGMELSVPVLEADHDSGHGKRQGFGQGFDSADLTAESGGSASVEFGPHGQGCLVGLDEQFLLARLARRDSLSAWLVSDAGQLQ